MIGFLFLCTFPVLVWGQDTIPKVAEGDLSYREDQFYAGVTYNLITNVPSDVNLRGVSGGVHFGFLRDMPVNSERNFSIALGAGLAFDRYGYNLFIGEDTNENTIFSVLDDSQINFNTNRFSTATIEVPLEIRWRTSTPTDYKFWRIYGGVRAGYTYWYRAFFSQDGYQVSQTDIPEFQQFNMAATLNFGYSTFNFYAYYSINPFFKDAVIAETGETLELRTLKLGVIFYIL
ncbi:MAG: outer membrane beta-barrel protein [Bacteroidota bacterium]